MLAPYSCAMDARRLVCALGLVLLAATGSGCAAGESEAGAGEATGHEQLCARLLRDLRLYCKQDVVRGDHAATSMDCLSRRLQFEKACF